MAGEVNDVAAPLWQQVAVFAGVAAAALVTALQSYRKGRAEVDSHASHVVLEQAQIADLYPIRDLSKRLAETYPLIETLDERSAEILRILRDQERDAEIAKGVEDRLREERMRADRNARDRDRGSR